MEPVTNNIRAYMCILRGCVKAHALVCFYLSTSVQYSFKSHES